VTAGLAKVAEEVAKQARRYTDHRGSDLLMTAVSLEGEDEKNESRCRDDLGEKVGALAR